MVTVLPGRHGWSVLRVGGGGEAGECGSARTTSGGAMNVSVPDPTRQSFFALASNHYRTRRHELSPLPLRSGVALFPARATPVVLTNGASLYIASATRILPRSEARRPRRPTKSRVRFLRRNRPESRACSQTRRAFRVPEVVAVPTVSAPGFRPCAPPPRGVIGVAKLRRMVRPRGQRRVSYSSASGSSSDAPPTPLPAPNDGDSGNAPARCCCCSSR